MKWKTGISQMKDGEPEIFGNKLLSLMQERTFTECAFLLLNKRLPSEAEKKLFDMILVSCVEHGISAPSVFSARTSASVGNPLNASVAAGLLATGLWHGGAIEAAAENLQSDTGAEQLVRETLERGERLPGYGHKIYKTTDPRSKELFAAARTLGLTGAYTEKAYALKDELIKQSGKELAINIDGCIAALISDMGFSWKVANGCFILGRIPGIIAHITEEVETEKPYRRLDDEDISFVG